MRFSLAVAALAPILSVYAENILVQVGAGGKLAFSPTNVTAKVGDTVSFQFQGKNHSVTQSSFASPCHIQTTPAQGVDSGFQFVANTSTQLPEWSITIDNDTSPLWFFCAQTTPASHCNAGMVFSINANPDSAKSFAVYQAAAMSDNNVAAAPSPDGGDSASTTEGGNSSSPTGSDAGTPTDGSDASDSAPTDMTSDSATDSAGGPAPTDSSSGSSTDGLSASASASAPLGAASDSASAPGSLPVGPTGDNGAPINVGSNAADNTSPSNTSSGSTPANTGAGFRLGTSRLSLLAAVGLAACMLL